MDRLHSPARLLAQHGDHRPSAGDPSAAAPGVNGSPSGQRGSRPIPPHPVQAAPNLAVRSRFRSFVIPNERCCLPRGFRLRSQASRRADHFNSRADSHASLRRLPRALLDEGVDELERHAGQTMSVAVRLLMTPWLASRHPSVVDASVASAWGATTLLGEVAARKARRAVCYPGVCTALISEGWVASGVTRMSM